MAKNQLPQKVDRNLARASQILTKTFTKHHQEINSDLDLLVNPKKVDLPREREERKEEETHDHHGHDHDHNEADTKPQKLSNATPYLLLIALCLDGFFEGLAIGVQSTWINVAFVAGAVLINKLAVGLGLGIQFKKAETEIQTFIRFILLFSLFCPFGIILGYNFATNMLVKAISLSFAAGTFIYVSASVCIVEEFTITKHRYPKYFCYILGGILCGALKVMTAEN